MSALSGGAGPTRAARKLLACVALGCTCWAGLLPPAGAGATSLSSARRAHLYSPVSRSSRGERGRAPATSATTRPARVSKARKLTLPKPSGDAATIAFYRKVVAATQANEGLEELYPPTSPMTQVLYSKKGLSWYIEAPAKAGYAPAADLVFIGASRGKVTFVADSVLYEGKGASFPPFGLLLTAKGEVLLAGGAPASTSPPGANSPVQPCVGPTKTAFVAGYPAVGVPFGYELYGHFEPMKRIDKGKAEEVTSTYPWSTKPPRTATEVDTIDLSDDLPVAGVVHVSAGGGLAAFTLSWVNKWSRSRLYPPKTTGTCLSYEKGLL